MTLHTRKCGEGVRVRGLVAGYKQGFRLGPLSLEASSREVLALIGPNASGKTTLLRVLAGILEPVEGEVKLCGLEWSRAYTKRVLLASPGISSYTPAVPEADPLLTPRELIKLYGGDVELALELVPELESILDSRLMHLSSGQRRLACIARSLSVDAPLVLIDEPVAFLDVSMQSRILGVLRKLAREEGKTVVVAMHELHLVSLVADRIALLSRGQLVASGPPREVLKRELIERVYSASLVEAKVGDRGVLLPSI